MIEKEKSLRPKEAAPAEVKKESHEEKKITEEIHEKPKEEHKTEEKKSEE